ncbi:MAG TPA: type VI secretion system contractile sheath large subunit [Bryobacteraceae bacterium]|nr:type VI secretion system contractile sheath large subunit [Bryobacteraceae bacterium]
MSQFSRSSVHLDVDAGTSFSPPERPESDTPFRILLMGDFSGRANRRAPMPARLKPVRVDRDNLDQVLAGMGASLELGRQGSGILLRFREMEDFHPDRIYRQSAIFDQIEETRARLADPATFVETAAALGRAKREVRPPASTAAAASSLSSGANLLDDILDASEGTPAATARRPDELRAFIDRAVAPHTVAREDPQLPELMAEVDAKASRLMRAVLHDPDFQALEAAWRAVFLLARGLETGPELKIYLLDVTKAELAGDVSGLHRLLVEESSIPGAEPWAVIAGNYSFARTTADLALLANLAKVARGAGAPFLAEADPAGDPDTEEAAQLWHTLRHWPGASWVGLALPRFLLRLPYGEKTDTIENFAFEEMPGKPEHGHYLWGNPAFACVYLLGQSFVQEGWDLRPGTQQEIHGLPLHVYEVDGEQQLKPCAEVWMSEKDAEWIMEQGFMPLASLKNQDTVRLVRFQSIAEPATALSGRWA